MKFVCAAALLLVLPGEADRGVAGSRPAAPNAASPVVVGYLPWYRVDALPPDEHLQVVTDLIYFGIEPTRDGRLPEEPIPAETLAKLRAARDRHHLQLHVCVGGGGRSAGFSGLAHSDRTRHAFVHDLCAYCRGQGIRGVDYDWEYPQTDAELATLAALVRETKRGLGGGGIVSVAQSPWHDFGAEVYAGVDRVHVMSYNHRFPQAGFDAAEADIERMLAFGCPAHKLVLGIPFYGRRVNGATRTYADLARDPEFAAHRDQLRGYAFNGTDTVRAKARYALSKQLGGVMVWELGQDARDPQRSLLNTLRLELGPSAEGAAE